MKKYKTSNGYYRYGFGIKIIEIEIERETEKSIWVDGRLMAKYSNYGVYHDTWKDAWDYLIIHATRKLDNAKSNHEKIKSIFDELLSMDLEG